MSAGFGTGTLKSTPWQQKLRAAVTRERQSECLSKVISVKKVNTLKPLTKNTMLYGYLQNGCFAGSFNSSSRDSSDNYRWILRNQRVVVCVFWKQHKCRKKHQSICKNVCYCVVTSHFRESFYRYESKTLYVTLRCYKRSSGFIIEHKQQNLHFFYIVWMPTAKWSQRSPKESLLRHEVPSRSSLSCTLSLTSIKQILRSDTLALQ